MILPIFTYDAPILRKKAKSVDDVTPQLKKLIENMFATMHEASGIGLAANQVGKEYAMTVVDISVTEDNENVPPLVLINPEIMGAEGKIVFEEGCLSLPDLRSDVVRPEKIGFTYFDEKMKRIEREADGLLARVVQHEIDHLNGIYFFDRLPPITLSLLKGKLAKIRNQKVETSYELATPEEMGITKRVKGKKVRL